MKDSKNVIIGVLIAVIVIALVGGGIYFFSNKTENKNAEGPNTNMTTTASSSKIDNNKKSKEETKKENTNGDDVSNKEQIVENAFEEYLKKEFGKVVEEIKFEKVKIYTKQEIESDELLKDHNIGPKDIVFEANYSLKIIDGYDDMIQFTAGTGEVEGQWVKEKYSCGIARYNSENDYSITDLGTSF